MAVGAVVVVQPTVNARIGHTTCVHPLARQYYISDDTRTSSTVTTLSQPSSASANMPFTIRSLFTSSTPKPDRQGAPQIPQPPQPYDDFLARYWPDDEYRRIVLQYQLNTHMREHWTQMLRKHPNRLELYRQQEYLEPITLSAVAAQTLAQR